MKKIESVEQREQALEWMVKTAQEVEHPLISEEDKAKKLKVYDYVSDQVQQYNKVIYAGSGYPSDQEEEKLKTEENQVNLSDWLDED
jgi:glutamine synthetase type III